MKIVSCLVVAAALAAAVPSVFATSGCSSSTASSSSPVSGTVGTVSFEAMSAVAINGSIATDEDSESDGGVIVTNEPGLEIEIADKANTCSEFHLASTNIVSIAVAGASVAPGTYTIIDGNEATPVAGQAGVDFSGSTDTCTDSGQSATATTGTVTITAISATSVSGSFDATFPTGHLTGSFTATICSGQGALISDDGGPACNP